MDPECSEGFKVVEGNDTFILIHLLLTPTVRKLYAAHEERGPPLLSAGHAIHVFILERLVPGSNHVIDLQAITY